MSSAAPHFGALPLPVGEREPTECVDKSSSEANVTSHYTARLGHAGRVVSAFLAASLNA